jgi:hypothetical protein
MGTETAYIYTGDLWGSAPDRRKGHDMQFWARLAFNDTAGGEGKGGAPGVAVMEYVDSFDLDLA